jgi:hypothetical protein
MFSKGLGFSRAANATKQWWALAPEGMLERMQDLFRGSLNARSNFLHELVVDAR